MTPDDLQAPLNDEKLKRVMKEALKEWLDEKFSEFGKWTFYGLLSAVFFALMYFILTTNGWQRLN